MRRSNRQRPVAAQSARLFAEATVSKRPHCASTVARKQPPVMTPRKRPTKLLTLIAAVVLGAVTYLQVIEPAQRLALAQKIQLEVVKVDVSRLPESAKEAERRGTWSSAYRHTLRLVNIWESCEQMRQRGLKGVPSIPWADVDAAFQLTESRLQSLSEERTTEALAERIARLQPGAS